MNHYGLKKYTLLLTLGVLVAIHISCKKFLLLDPPVDSISAGLVFDNDDSAKSAVGGIYSSLIRDGVGFANGSITSITSLAGMSADELITYTLTYNDFYTNSLLPTSITSFQWGSPYARIYAANAILEGLKTSDKVSENVKKQLEGEAKFIRAFCYFYLTNLYGDVPLNLTTNYIVNAKAIRTRQEDVYTQIVKDLIDAKLLLGNEYYTIERIRANKWAATALLARVYLYTKNYLEAENLSTSIISNTSMYGLKSELNDVFLKNSTEAILQLMPVRAGFNTEEGSLFIFTNTPTSVSITQNLVDAFEPGDKRRTQWIGSTTVGTKSYYYPFKYKVSTSSNLSEYSMVLRLAEQYLIRAEARINQPGKIALGIGDLNILRTRARAVPTVTVPNPLPALDINMDKASALLAVEKERRIELFSEWGHRWLDLKRTERANAVLAPLKGSTWQSTDVLWPIPQTDIINNSLLIQNLGY